jgi:excinuclease ABC subunit C
MSVVLLKTPDKLDIRLREIPVEPGVYLMRDTRGEILYIGKSKKLRTRVRSYFQDTHLLSGRISLMVQQIADIEFIVTDTEAEALALEANLIKQHQPHFNVLLKDDRRYPYVCITWSEDYPRIFITRKRRQTGQAKDRYYGPYVDSQLLRQTLQWIQRIFPLRQRPRPLFKDRPCLNYDLGRCPGVCQSLISPQDYQKTLSKIAMVFQGRTEELVNHLEKQMTELAKELKFEQAGVLRDQIKALQSLTSNQKVTLADETISRDAIALAMDSNYYAIQLFQIRAGRLVSRLGFFAERETGNPAEVIQKVLEEHYLQAEDVEIPNEILVQEELLEPEILLEWLTGRKGKRVTLSVPQRQSKAELLTMVQRNAQYELERTQRQAERSLQSMEDLSELLNLSKIPKRIEGYDISHIQGSDAVASQVVFIDGVPSPQHYRHYKIKNPNVRSGHSDDFASLAEVITRRFKGTKQPTQADFPDLIMIDGGKGQLSSVVSVLEELAILPHLTVISLAKQREEVFLPGESEPILSDPEQPGLQLLRRLRDEAHRFAVTFHRQQRLKRSRRSYLDEIPGLGFERKKQLLAHFHSIDYIRSASIEQLQAVSGIGPQLAQDIYHYFHNSSD